MQSSITKLLAGALFGARMVELWTSTRDEKLEAWTPAREAEQRLIRVTWIDLPSISIIAKLFVSRI